MPQSPPPQFKVEGPQTTPIARLLATNLPLEGSLCAVGNALNVVGVRSEGVQAQL